MIYQYPAKDVDRICDFVHKSVKKLTQRVGLPLTIDTYDIIRELVVLSRFNGDSVEELEYWMETPNENFSDLRPVAVIQIHPKRMMEYLVKQKSLHYQSERAWTLNQYA